MKRSLWVLNRVASALAGAALIGLAAALLFTEQFAQGTPQQSALGIVAAFLWYSLFCVPTAVAFGAIPGFLALTLTSAKRAPWRSLAALLPATYCGFLLWFALNHSVEPAWPTWLTLLLLPSAAGLLAAFNLKRIPAPLGLRAHH